MLAGSRPLGRERGWEAWDVPTLLQLYADDVEIVQLDRDNPPTSPRIRHGEEVIEGMARHCAAAGVKATVENAVVGPERAAATVTCEIPGGRRVVSNAAPRAEGGDGHTPIRHRDR